MAEDHDAAACACRVQPGADVPPALPAAWRAARRRQVRDTTRSRGRGGTHDVEVVLLDMGGVVIPTLFESVDVPGFPAGPFGQEEAYATVERGERQEREYWADLVARRPDLDLGSLWRTCSRVRPQLVGVLERLAGVVRLVAFTNDMAHWFGPDWPARFPELAAFDRILEATQLGAMKPDPEAFRRACAALGEAPERCLFVDDLTVNLEGAAAAGLHTLLFDVRDPGGSVAALTARLGVAPAPPPSARRVFSPR